MAYDYFRRIDQLGGMVEAVKQGFPQAEIADAAFALQMGIDAKERLVVGVNEYVEPDEAEIETLQVDPALEPKQVGRLQAVRAARDGDAVARELWPGSRRTPRPGPQPDATLLECARAHVTEGEIVAALQEVFGDYRDAPIY